MFTRIRAVQARWSRNTAQVLGSARPHDVALRICVCGTIIYWSVVAWAEVTNPERRIPKFVLDSGSPYALYRASGVVASHHGTFRSRLLCRRAREHRAHVDVSSHSGERFEVVGEEVETRIGFAHRDELAGGECESNPRLNFFSN